MVIKFIEVSNYHIRLIFVVIKLIFMRTFNWTFLRSAI
jgi:hypothetical protein